MFGSFGSMMAAVPGFYEQERKRKELEAQTALQEVQKKDTLERLLLAQNREKMMLPLEAQKATNDIANLQASTETTKLANDKTKQLQPSEIGTTLARNALERLLMKADTNLLPLRAQSDEIEFKSKIATENNKIKDAGLLSAVMSSLEYLNAYKQNIFDTLSKQGIENKVNLGNLAINQRNSDISQGNLNLSRERFNYEKTKPDFKKEIEGKLVAASLMPDSIEKTKLLNDINILQQAERGALQQAAAPKIKPFEAVPEKPIDASKVDMNDPASVAQAKLVNEYMNVSENLNKAISENQPKELIAGLTRKQQELENKFKKGSFLEDVLSLLRSSSPSRTGNNLKMELR